MSGALRYRAFPLVLAAPSGTGKTTIARELVSRHPEFVFSISATTRAPRAGEEEGRDYQFVSRGEFEAMIERGDLAEWAEVHGHLYGTPKEPLEQAADAGRHAVLDIDVQGARQLRHTVPEAVLIFVFPPAAKDLYRRLTFRGTEGREEVERRLRTARTELEAAAEFDYVIVNDDLEQAISQVRAVVGSESHAVKRLPGLSEDVARIRDEITELLAREGARGPAVG